MSTAQLVALASRKAYLIERISAQRVLLSAHIEPLRKPLALADKLVRAVHFIKQRPWIAGVAVFATLVLGRRNLLRWAGRSWTLWRGWRVANAWLHENGYLKN